MADDAAAYCIQGNILSLAPKIVKVADKKNLLFKSAISLLHMCQHSGENDESAELTAGKNFCSFLACIASQ